jgi:hypothetical protein
MDNQYHYVKGSDAVQFDLESTHPEISRSLAQAIDQILTMSGFTAVPGRLAGELFKVRLTPSHHITTTKQKG